MLNFYPGPSKIYPQVNHYLTQGLEEGLLSFNHRSPEFVNFSKKAIFALKEKINIPADYGIFFPSSATECWEIIAQSLFRHRSFHLFNGAFGEKAWLYTQRLKPAPELVKRHIFDLHEAPKISKIKKAIEPHTELIALTHNETSNGSALPEGFLEELRLQFPEELISVDATSSLGGVNIDFKHLDICYASVQKCLGMPAGMAVLIVSPRTMKRAEAIGERYHYNSFLFMRDKMKDFQTPYTPNILNIYLLSRLMEEVDNIQLISKRIKNRARDLYAFFENLADFECINPSEDLRSDTVLCIQSSEEKIKKIKEAAKKQNIILGNGYSSLKSTTFRVANFPSILDSEIEQLKEFLTEYTE